jgi:hypothetical protein
MIRRLAFLHWFPSGVVHQLHRYYQDAMTACRPSRRASLPSFGGTSAFTRGFAPRRTSEPPGPGVGHPVSPAGMSPRRRQALPSSWGTSIVRLPCSVDSGGTACTRPLRCRSVALGVGITKAPTIGLSKLNRWLSDWLSTLRSAGYPVTTQDSLPAAGQALPDGLSTRKVPMKGFKVTSLHLILLSQAFLAQSDTPTQPSGYVFAK